MVAIAHVRKLNDGTMDVQNLGGDSGHLQQTAKLAGQFGSVFDSQEWTSTAGLWHDLGKYKPIFQEYIRTASGFENDETGEGGSGKVDHTSAGAIYATTRHSLIGRILAYVIAGHHSGLPDFRKAEAKGRGLEERLSEKEHWNEALLGGIPEAYLNSTLPTDCSVKVSNQMHLWIRMLFSCLVDADFLDTESFMNPEFIMKRKNEVSLEYLRDRYNQYMSHLMSSADYSSVNQLRQTIFEDCRSGAVLKPGFFSLSVPTGGGKTLASIGFALDHALKYGKSRIIIAIPFTSIIEQTADTLRKVFGNDNVLEHHSNLNPDKETLNSKLAAENWDAPIVVTTNVQLFESLFAARTSSCRKIHNVVNAVIILDEAQTLPPEFLKPILSALQGLVDIFKVSVVLCTATQPVLSGWIGSRQGPHGQGGFEGVPLDKVRELMREPISLFQQMQRTRVELFHGGIPCEWSDIAEELLKYTQVLCIVNTRKNCRELFSLLPKNTIHLSALMCGEHRSQVIASIKSKLKNGEPIRVISTQLVEAGVDIDFPVVFRAMAGLDSIAQAAGRCNREGHLDHFGSVIVFQPLQAAPTGLLRKGEDSGKEMFRLYPDLVQILNPDIFKIYFENFYKKIISFDEKQILDLLAGPDTPKFQFQFRTAAQHFHLIDDQKQKNVIVWFTNGDESVQSSSLLDELAHAGPNRTLLRRLQRYSVTVSDKVWNTLCAQGSIQEIQTSAGPSGIWAQCVPDLYDPVVGLRLSNFDCEFVC